MLKHIFKAKRTWLFVVSCAIAFIAVYWGVGLVSAASGPREYAMAGIDAAGGYHGGYAVIETAIPQVRDGGFSGETLWVGPAGCNYAEVGWRTTGEVASPRWYWGYYDTSCVWHSNWAGYPTVGAAYSYRITKSSGTLWDIWIGSTKVQTVNLGTSVADLVRAGGEVSHYDPYTHNAIGVSGFFNLQYLSSGGSWYPWGNWTYLRVDPGYTLVKVSNTEFQNYGYN